MIEDIPFELIGPNPFQTRKVGEGDSISSVGTIGLLRVALIVRPHPDDQGRYQLAFGHRTLKTLKKLGKSTVPCEVRQLGDETMAKMLYRENEDRKPLSDFERGEFFKKYMGAFGLSLRRAAEELDEDISTLSRCMAIAESADQVLGGPNTIITPESYRLAVTDSKFKEVTKVKDEPKKIRALAAVAEHDLSTNETRALIAEIWEGKSPEQATNEILLQRETHKPEHYSLKKAGLTNARCGACGEVLIIAHRDGFHVLVDEKKQ